VEFLLSALSGEGDHLDFNLVTRRARGALIWVACVLGLASAPLIAAQPPNVLDFVGGNASNSDLLWLDFDSGEAVRLNDDATTRTSLRSIEFFKNTCATRLDVVATDTRQGRIVLYPNGRGNAIALPCPGGQCTSRLDGLSSSNERLMAVADAGSISSTPSVWIYAPSDCSADLPFQAPKSGGPLSIAGASGPATLVRRIVDTEFVKVLGGGLGAGDLLVLTTSPTTIARIPHDRIIDLVEGRSTTLGVAEVLVDEAFFGLEIPTGLAFVPATAGIGAADDLSESEDLLVALASGRVLRVTFTQQTTTLAKGYESEIFVSGLGTGSLGIAAGTRGQDTYMVIADRQQGRFLLYPLDVSVDGTLSPPSTPQTIQAGVQRPQGVAIISDAYAASSCTGGQSCIVRRSAGLQFDTQRDLSSNIVLANIFVVPDAGRDSDGFLSLSGISTEFDTRFRVPPSCRGFPLPDEPDTSVLIVLNINTDVTLDPGDFVQTRERLSQIIPQLNDPCEVTGARLYYHPDAFGASEPEQGRLYDITYDCSNPSRSIGRGYSPIVICTDPLYREIRASAKPIGDELAKKIEAAINLRIDNMLRVIGQLPSSLTDLRRELSSYLRVAKNLAKSGNYIAAAAELDKGAVAVARAKDVGRFDDPLIAPATTYGDLLSRFLALGFFTYESISGGDLKFQVPFGVCEIEPQLEGCSQ
jgi:hypothetical protein